MIFLNFVTIQVDLFAVQSTSTFSSGFQKQFKGFVCLTFEEKTGSISESKVNYYELFLILLKKKHIRSQLTENAAPPNVC